MSAGCPSLRRAVCRLGLHVVGLTLAIAVLPALGAGSPKVGEAAPALRVPDLSGHRIDLGAWRGKVVIVNFWATWCTPCRAEMPALEAVYQRHRTGGLELIGLSVDDEHDLNDVKKVMSRFSYPAAMLSAAQVNGFGMPAAVPLTYVIDGTGVIRARLIAGGTAGVSEQMLEKTVLPLLQK